MTIAIPAPREAASRGAPRVTFGRLRRTSSLRWQLPALISALIMAVLATFLWVAYQGVRQTLVETAAARAREVANQVGSMLVQSSQQRRAEMMRVAGDPVVRAYLEHPDGDAAVVRARLATLALPNGAQSIELWNRAGVDVLSVPVPADADSALPPGLPPATSPPAPFRASAGAIYSEMFVPVGPSGFLVIRRPLNANGSAAINRLIGSGAALEVGNAAGDIWTDLAQRVPVPDGVDLTRRGVAQVRVANGQRRLGVVAGVGDTGLAVWLDFPESVVLAPARLFLERMALVALGVVVIAALVTGILTARITTPLHQLTEAAEAIAGGEYSRRVAATRSDEVGRLGTSFNAMTEEIATMHRDLERRVEERTARLTEARTELDRFFSLSIDMLSIKGVDGGFKRVNPAWERTLGWSADELTAMPLSALVHPDDLAVSANELSKLSTGAAAINFANRYRCKDGSYRWLAWNAAGLPERGLIYAAVRDVTEERRIDQELRDRVAELDAVNRELEAFSYSVSHDLRAPLRHITGFANLLQRSVSSRLSEQEARHMRTIIDAATRMGRLIDDLLAFSRLGRTALSVQPIGLDAVVDDALRELQGLPGTEVAWTIQRPLPIVDGDPAMLRLVFVNLLSNAVKYSGVREVPAVEIGAISGGAETVVFVRDNGVGFEMQYAHKLFGVFQRLHSADAFEGTGIGLANVRRIVQRHGGRVWAEGAVDAGATFFFSLPATGVPGDR